MKLYCPLFSHWQWKKMIEMFCSISFPDGGLSNSTSRTTTLSCPIFSPISNKQHPLHQPDPSSRAHWTNSKRLINNGTSALLMKVLIIIKASEQELKKKVNSTYTQSNKRLNVFTEQIAELCDRFKTLLELTESLCKWSCNYNLKKFKWQIKTMKRSLFHTLQQHLKLLRNLSKRDPIYLTNFLIV